MPKLCAILQLVSAPLNPITTILTVMKYDARAVMKYDARAVKQTLE